MSIANMLLAMAVYILVPSFPIWLLETERFSQLEVGLSMGAFALGLYLFGPFCSWLRTAAPAGKYSLMHTARFSPLCMAR